MKKLRITIGNKSYDVTVEDLTEPDTIGSVPPVTPNPAQKPAELPPAAPAAAPSKPPAGTGTVTSPMAGVIRKVLVEEGDQVDQGQALVVLEAMKMENQITAPVAGVVKKVDVNAGDSVQEGHVLLELE